MKRTWVLALLMAGLVMGQDGDGKDPAKEPAKEGTKVDGKEAAPEGAEAAPEEKAKPAKTADSKGVVVTAERLATDRRLSGETYGLIDSRDIEIHTNLDLQQAIRFVPGVHVVQTSGKGGLTSLFIRGGESDHALVMIDGVEVNSDGGGIDLALFTNDGAGRLEIVRGSPSSVWGADSMSGAVHMITRRGEGAPRVRISGEAGNRSMYRERLGFETGTEEYGVNIALSRFDRNDGEGDHSEYNNTTANGRFDYQIGDATALKLTLRYVDEQAEQFAVDPGPRFTEEDHNGFKRENDLVLGLEASHQVCDMWTVSARIGRFDERVRFNDIGPGDFDSMSEFSRTKFGFQSDVTPLDTESYRDVITAGVEYEREELETSDSFSGGLGVDERRYNRAIYVQNRFEAWDRLGITLSGRGDRSSAFHTAWTGRVAASFDVKETGTRPHASFANGVKTPTMVESFSTNIFFLGNKDLKPEESRTWDFGIEQRFCDDKVIFDITAFENRMRRLVVFTGLNPAFENGGNAVARGVELSLKVQPVDEFSLSAGYTYQHTRVTNATVETIAFQDREQLLRRPHHEGYIQAAFQLFYSEDVPASQKLEHPRFGISAQAQYVGQRDDVIFNSFPTPADRVVNDDYIKVDLTAEYWIIDRTLRAFGSVENVFDSPYEEVVGYPNEHVTFFVGLEFAFNVPKLSRTRKK